MMDPATVALIAALAGALLRELLAWRERRDRQRGQKRTRSGDW
jgi:hypothetical protein